MCALPCDPLDDPLSPTGFGVSSWLPGTVPTIREPKIRQVSPAVLPVLDLSVDEAWPAMLRPTPPLARTRASRACPPEPLLQSLPPDPACGLPQRLTFEPDVRNASQYHRDDPAAVKGPFDFLLPPEPMHLRMLRKAARSSLRDMGLEEPASDEVVLVLDEIISNSIEHGQPYRRRFEPLRVHLHLEGSTLVLRFQDPEMPEALIEELRRALDRTRGKLPALELERGRGLFLVAASLHDVRVERDQQGTWLRGTIPGVTR